MAKGFSIGKRNAVFINTGILAFAIYAFAVWAADKWGSDQQKQGTDFIGKIVKQFADDKGTMYTSSAVVAAVATAAVYVGYNYQVPFPVKH